MKKETETTQKERWNLRDHMGRFKARLELMMPRELLMS